uniref:Uncharacterized protein n=1 Tax=Chaetoceros debilis TaxID=122233 RepID=A0A7S3Q3B5_9STRA
MKDNANPTVYQVPKRDQPQLDYIYSDVFPRYSVVDDDNENDGNDGDGDGDGDVCPYPECGVLHNVKLEPVEDIIGINTDHSHHHIPIHVKGMEHNHGIDDDELIQSRNDSKDAHSQHGVPCTLCNRPNRSCIIPPTIAPANLVGCMLGRACMERPCLFWDVDRYFYGEASNPCRDRRQLLEEYCEYIERTYPRRCCDDDVRVTRRMPAPKIDIGQDQGGCDICQDVYGPRHRQESQSDDNKVEVEGAAQPASTSTSTSTSTTKKKMKISSNVIKRSIRPITGVFYKVYGQKQFRQACDRYSRDDNMRNCGPGYIIRKAMKVMSDEALDLPFLKTEDPHLNVNEWLIG